VIFFLISRALGLAHISGLYVVDATSVVTKEETSVKASMNTEARCVALLVTLGRLV